MSFKNLGNKQTIILHNCEIDNKKYDLVITPHTQTVGYIRTKRQTLKRKIITKQRQITRKRFSKNRNAFSESETNSLDELYKLKESIDKNFKFITKRKKKNKKTVQTQTSTSIQLESTNSTH